MKPRCVINNSIVPTIATITANSQAHFPRGPARLLFS